MPRSLLSVAQEETGKGVTQTVIEGLEKELLYLAERKPLITEVEKQKGRAVTIMGDQNVPYTLLKKVMSTCAGADYRDISLAVNALPGIDEEAFIQSNAAAVVGEG